MRNKSSYLLFGLSVFMIGQNAHASLESTGPNGINSSGLGLTGNGIGIGQVEEDRPGDPDLDTIAARFNSSINPKEVYFGTLNTSTNMIDFTPTANAIGNTGGALGHGTLVAGLIISTEAITIGVAPQAELYSSGFAPTIFSFEVFSRTAQFIAERNGGNIPAINVSTGYSLTGNESPDGTSLVSSFTDWSAKKHDVLYVAVGPYTSIVPGTATIRIPADNFNGITVAFSKKNGAKYRQVDSRNIVIPSTGRTYIDLIAPGDENIFIATQDNGIGSGFGTSIAAPLVTGTVALLQEHAKNVGWGANARRHEVMKAVLMNSADKVAGVLGSTRTVLNKNGKDWFDASNPAATDSMIPLHEEFGAGHLNAKRALQQFLPGEQNPGLVPAIGWDFETTGGINSETRYEIGTPLQADDYISITLAWDRLVEFDRDRGTTNQYDIGDTFESYVDLGHLEEQVNDLGIYLVERGQDYSTVIAGAFSDGIVANERRMGSSLDN